MDIKTNIFLSILGILIATGCMPISSHRQFSKNSVATLDKLCPLNNVQKEKLRFTSKMLIKNSLEELFISRTGCFVVEYYISHDGEIKDYKVINYYGNFDKKWNYILQRARFKKSEEDWVGIIRYSHPLIVNY